MKAWIKWILITLTLAAVIHILAVMAVPYAVMFLLRMSTDREVNAIYHQAPVTAESRDVVRPSPDLLYSACPYDVSEKPLRISSPVPDTYFSISGFAANTDNFFVVSDRQVKSKQMEILLVGKGKPYPDAGDAQVVVAPTDLGVVLFRTLIKDRDKLNDLIKVQRQASCKPVE